MDGHGAIESDERAAFIYGGMSVAQRGGTCDIHPFMDALRLFMDARLLARVRAFLRVCVFLRGRRAGREGCLDNSLARLTWMH
jgi:hypothetical protein